MAERTQLDRIEETVDRLDLAIRGNGKPGLNQRMDEVESAVNQMRATRARWFDKVLGPAIAGLVVGMVMMAIQSVI